MKAQAVVTSKGQVTVPKAVRDALGVHEGDILVFEVEAGTVRVRPSRPGQCSAGALKKFLPADWQAPTVEDMDRGIARALTDRVPRR